jgi:hypothetical protein
MKIFTIFIFVVATLFLMSCSKPQPAIIGRWHQVDVPKGFVAFHEDGTVEISNGQLEVSGKYSFITKRKLKIEVSDKISSFGTRVYEVVFASDKMSWTGTDIDGQKTQYLKTP